MPLTEDGFIVLSSSAALMIGFIIFILDGYGFENNKDR